MTPHGEMTPEQNRAITFFLQPWVGTSVYGGVKGTF